MTRCLVSLVAIAMGLDHFKKETMRYAGGDSDLLMRRTTYFIDGIMLYFTSNVHKVVVLLQFTSTPIKMEVAVTT